MSPDPFVHNNPITLMNRIRGLSRHLEWSQAPDTASVEVETGKRRAIVTHPDTLTEYNRGVGTSRQPVTGMKGYPLFRDRRDAGRRLAEKLTEYANQNPVVLGLPRGGVVVGYEIARTLNASLDVIVARKLGVPMQPELGFGAIAPGGVVLVNQNLVDQLGLSQQDLDEVENQERIEMERRLHHYRGDGLPEVRGCTAILVDDGLATGVTAEAAIRAAKRLGAAHVVLAVAVCSRDTADRLREMVDDLVCVFCPEPFIAVGIWYEQFEQNTDEEVIELLDRANDAIRTRHDKMHGN